MHSLSRRHVLELHVVRFTFRTPISLDQPGSCRLLASCGRAQVFVDLSWRYFGIPDSIFRQANGGFDVDVNGSFFALYYLIDHCSYRGQMIPTVTGGVS